MQFLASLFWTVCVEYARHDRVDLNCEFARRVRWIVEQTRVHDILQKPGIIDGFDVSNSYVMAFRGGLSSLATDHI